MKIQITIDDISEIRSYLDITNLFQKLGYTTHPAPLCLRDFDLDRFTVIKSAYLIGSHTLNSQKLLVILFELTTNNYMTQKAKNITESFCKYRSEKFLFIFTHNYKNMLLVSPLNTLIQGQLKCQTKTHLIQCEEPSYTNINTIQRLRPNNRVPAELNKVHQRVLQDAEMVRLSHKNVAIHDSVRRYLIDIGKIPLLKPEEEIELARKIYRLEKLKTIRSKTAENLGVDIETITKSQWAREAGMDLSELDLHLTEGHYARKKMIESNLRLVVSIAKQYLNRGLDLLDLIQEGNLGLIRATEKFDPERGNKFSTYATWWIKQAIKRGITNQSRTIRLPVHLWENISKIKRTIKALTQEIGCTPSLSAIIQRTGLTSEKITQICQLMRPIQSLEIAIGEDDINLVDFIESPSMRPEQFITEKMLREDIEQLLENLTDKQRKVIEERYGWHDDKEKSLQEIGQVLNITRERVRQIEAKALKILSGCAFTRQLEDYL